LKSELPEPKPHEALSRSFFGNEERQLIQSIENAWAENPSPLPGPAELERIRALWRQVWVNTMRAQSAAEAMADPPTNRF